VATPAEAAARFGSQKIADIQGEVMAAALPPTEIAAASETDTKKNPRHDVEWTFPFRYVTKRGKIYEGDFTNRILVNRETQAVAAIAARIAQSAPVESLSATTRAFNEALAHMSVSFRSSSGEIRAPAWAEDLGELVDADVVWELWDRVRRHEADFFRYEPSPEDGSE